MSHLLSLLYCGRLPESGISSRRREDPSECSTVKLLKRVKVVVSSLQIWRRAGSIPAQVEIRYPPLNLKPRKRCDSQEKSTALPPRQQNPRARWGEFLTPNEKTVTGVAAYLREFLNPCQRAPEAHLGVDEALDDSCHDGCLRPPNARRRYRGGAAGRGSGQW